MRKSTTRTWELLGTISALAIACAGCVVEEAPGYLPDNAEPNAIELGLQKHSLIQSEQSNCNDVTVTVTQTGTNEYRIVAHTIIDENVSTIWTELRDFEQLVAIALPGIAANFEWITGGPNTIPSTFQFDTGGDTLYEEIYYRSDYHHKLRYLLLEPALGITEYDAIIDLDPTWSGDTVYTATREVTLDPGALQSLVDLFEVETQNIKDYFEGNSALAAGDAASH